MSILFRVVGGAAIIAASFFATIFVMDYFANGPSPGMVVIEASYGSNCGTKPGNQTGYFESACNRKKQCSVLIDITKMGGDPAPGCAKDFSIKYVCRPNTPLRSASIPAEAYGKTLALDCQNG
jgi:hypothetical protein